MGIAYKLKDHLDVVPYKRMGTPAYWPPEMEEGTSHHAHYNIYCLGLMLLEMRTAQPPYDHLAHLPWEQQRLRRTCDELVACGCSKHLLPSEWKFLQQCLEVNCGSETAGTSYACVAGAARMDALHANGDGGRLPAGAGSLLSPHWQLLCSSPTAQKQPLSVVFGPHACGRSLAEMLATLTHMVIPGSCCMVLVIVPFAGALRQG